jgi:hypothetical protein
MAEEMRAKEEADRLVYEMELKRKKEEDDRLRMEEYNRGVQERIEAEWAEERRIEKKARDQEEARLKKL